MMRITVTGKHLDITEPIRAYASEKANKLSKYFDQILSVEVIADTSENRHYEVEMIVRVAHHEPFIAVAKGDDLYATIDQTEGKLERQLSDHNSRLKNHKHNPAR